MEEQCHFVSLLKYLCTEIINYVACEQMNQNYVHHVYVKELKLWFIFGPEKFKNIDFMESTPKSRSVGIAHCFKHISIAIWLNSLEYQFHGRDICPFLEKST